MAVIKVLNIISDTNIGGAGRVLANYLRHADRQHFDTHIALPEGSLLAPMLEELGGTVHFVAGMADRSYHRDDVAQLKSLIATVKPDVIHTHGALSGRIAAKRMGVPVVFSRHSVFPVSAKLHYPPGRWVNRLLNHHYSNHIIAVSPAAADNLTQAGVSKDRITVIMNGVSPITPISAQEQTALKASLNIPANTFVFGILARVEEYKGHLLIAEAAQMLKALGKPFRILVAGTGPFEAQLGEALSKLGVDDCVTMLGFRRDVPAILSILDVQLNASYGTEATSLSLLEGMSMGLPAIVSDYGGNPYLIEHASNGLVFPSRDSHALYKCMARMMEDESLRETLSLGSVASYTQRYTGEIFAENTQKIYNQLLKRS